MNLDYFSVIRLSSFIISLCIAVYLFKLPDRAAPTLRLAWMFCGGALINLSTFLEFAGPYYWQPHNLKNLIIPFLQALGPALAACSLASFTYHFPHFRKEERTEQRVVLVFCLAVNTAVLLLTWYNFVFLKMRQGYLGFEKTYYIIFYLALAVQFILAILLLLRKIIRLSAGKTRPWWLKLLKPQGKDARAIRSLTLVLCLPTVVLGVYLLENRGVLPPYLATYFIWLFFLLLYSSFAITYLNHTPEPTTFQMKLVGLVLVLVVVTQGVISLFAGRAFEEDYVNRELVSARQTLSFAANEFGSYTVSRAPYRFDSEMGARLEVPFDRAVGLELDFPFPFYDRVFDSVQVLHGPMIYLGRDIREQGWGGYHPQPAIAPLLTNLALDRGGGIFAKRERDRLTITWYELPEYGFAGRNTLQLSLSRDGTITFSYRDINIESSYSPIQMYVYTSASITGRHPGSAGEALPVGPRLLGIHPGEKKAPLKPLRFQKALPYTSRSPEVLFEAYDIDFYYHLHTRMSVLVVILVASSLLVLFGLPLLFKASLIRPLQALHRGMEQADQGDLQVTVIPQSNDEIGALTRYFNRMLQSITKAEANFRTLAENAEDGILILSQEGAVVYANRAAGTITGYSERELARLSLPSLLKGGVEENKEIRSEPGRLLEKIPAEATVMTRDAAKVPVELTVSRIVWHGSPAYVTILRDISERKRGEEQARALQQRLIQADKLTTLGVLAGEVAHEISNPNQIILSSAAYLAEAWPQLESALGECFGQAEQLLVGGIEARQFLDSVPACLAEIADCSRRIDGIVKDTKSYIREDPRNLQSSLDLNSVVRSAVELSSHHIRRATDRFTLRLAEALPRVKGNAQRIEQVIVNLVLNACQSLADRNRAVTVSTCYDQERGQVMIEVDDQGCGIPAEQLAQLTNPLFTTKYEIGGTGLGLHIADMIVKDHHGSLVFMSIVGKGTKVTAAFPQEE